MALSQSLGAAFEVILFSFQSIGGDVSLFCPAAVGPSFPVFADRASVRLSAS
jgi:hypothetical protein